MDKLKVFKGVIVILGVLIFAVGLLSLGTMSHEFYHMIQLKQLNVSISEVCFIGMDNLDHNPNQSNAQGWVVHTPVMGEEKYAREFPAYVVTVLVFLFGFIIGTCLLAMIFEEGSYPGSSDALSQDASPTTWHTS